MFEIKHGHRLTMKLQIDAHLGGEECTYNRTIDRNWTSLVEIRMLILRFQPDLFIYFVFRVKLDIGYFQCHLIFHNFYFD